MQDLSDLSGFFLALQLGQLLGADLLLGPDTLIGNIIFVRALAVACGSVLLIGLLYRGS
jgi:hypothetical protein